MTKAMPKGHTQISMRCETCAHEWTAEMYDPTRAARLDLPDDSGT